MIPKPLSDINDADLQNLISNEVMEGKTIEYKRELPGGQDADRKEFLADVSSFANTMGGDLLFGVKAVQGVPVQLVGITAADLDRELQRLDNLIADGIDPRIRYSHYLVPIAGGQRVLVFRIERSWIGPHRVTFKGHDKFYGRNATRKYPLDVGELRHAFTLSATVAERMRAFRADRIIALSNNDTPIPFTPGPKIVLHCLPFNAFSTTQNLDVVGLRPDRLRPICLSGYNHRINFNGLITYSGGTEPNSYAQLYRNGILEAVDASLFWGGPSENFIPSVAYEEALLSYLPTCLALLQGFGCGLPLFVALSLTNVKGFFMGVKSSHRREVIHENILILPEAEVADYGVSADAILKPLFDMVWNAAGYPGSLNFDASGAWKHR